MGISFYNLRVKGGPYSYYTLWGTGGPYSIRKVAYDTSAKDTKNLSFLPLIFHGLLQKTSKFSTFNFACSATEGNMETCSQDHCFLSDRFGGTQPCVCFARWT